MHQRSVLINISAMRANPALGRDREPCFAFCDFLTCLHISGLLGCRAEGPSLFPMASRFLFARRKDCIIIKLLTNFVNDFVVPDEATWRAYVRFVLGPRTMHRLDGSMSRPGAPCGFAQQGWWEAGGRVNPGARVEKLCGPYVGARLRNEHGRSRGGKGPMLFGGVA